ncbi:hypothetical protein Btru_017244 [Bulinus truncatus]|nr:hypothetical protein Btru_017244 [Bulinus truncatus]
MDHDDANGVLDFSPTQPPPAQPVGIYGWRKRCLYAFVLLLMIVVIMNLALTVWILRILRFSLDGMGHLKIVPNGIELKAEAEFLKTVYVKQLKSEGNPLFLESTKSVQLLATDNGKKVKSKLVVDKDNVTVTCDTFRVVDSSGSVNLLLSSQRAILGNGDVTVPGNLTFKGAIFVPTIQSPLNSSLQISSENSLHLSAIGNVELSSTLGNMSISTTDNIYVESPKISLMGKEIYLMGIPTVEVTSQLRPKPTDHSIPTVHQLCVCANGKTFLALPSEDCVANSDTCPGTSGP